MTRAHCTCMRCSACAHRVWADTRRESIRERNRNWMRAKRGTTQPRPPVPYVCLCGRAEPGRCCKRCGMSYARYGFVKAPRTQKGD